MSLDNFQLPYLIIPELYKDSLIALDERQDNDDSLLQIKMPFLGNYRQKIVLLVSHEHVPFLSEADLLFLTGILGACKLQLADIALVNSAHTPNCNFEALQSILQPEKIIFFGMDAVDLEMPLSFPNYQLQKYAGMQLLMAPSLANLQSHVEEKKKLWTVLKIMFNL